MLQRVLRSFTRSAHKSKRHFVPRRSLTLEHLEDRRLLAAIPSLTTSTVSLATASPADVANWAEPTYVRYSPGNGVPAAATGNPVGFTPAQIRAAYGFNSVSFGAVAGDGTGTTIAIVDAYDDPNVAHDLAAFDAQFGLAAPPTFTKVNQTGGTSYPVVNRGWITEIALDVEWSHAIAPGANLLLVEANSNSPSDLLTAVDYARHAAGVVAVSMSWGGGESPSDVFSYDSYFTTPAGHAGVTFLASSGDQGAPPSYPAISSDVVSVGGTSLYLTAQNNYSSEAAWSGSGGGISWYESQPAYQKGVVTQSTTMRTNPDVAYDSNPSTGFPVYDSYNNGTTIPWCEIGGTSDAAPQWAALVAIVDQGRALAGKGSLDGATQTLPLLYAASAGDFHDITTGASTGKPPYSAGPGYDLVTGRGTPYANQIISDLVNASYTSTTLGVSAGSITYGQSVTLTATVTVVAPGTGTPTGGTVSFMDYGTVIGSATLDNGTATFTTSTLNTGTHELTAAYSGSGTCFWPSSTPGVGLTSTSIITTVAGDGIGDGTQATTAVLSNPCGAALDSVGDLFIADTSDNRVREVNHATGVITTVAGTGTVGYSGDGGQATAAMLSRPDAVALDSAGNLYIADTQNNCIRKVVLSTGVITTVAGSSSAHGFLGDNGPATAASLEYPQGVAVDTSGNLFIADSSDNRIREVNHSTGIITTVAGNGMPFYGGDNGRATSAELDDPSGVAVDSSGNLYIADTGDIRIRKVKFSTGIITTVAGTGTSGYNGDGIQATAARLSNPIGVAVDAGGNLFIADDYNNRVREVYAANSLIATVAGNGTNGFSGDGGAATAAALSYPQAVAVDSAGNLDIADSRNNRIRTVNHSTGLMSTFAGGYLGDGGAATTAILAEPCGDAVDALGNIFVADTDNNRVREINHATGAMTTVAGTGATGYNGDNLQATAATLSSPRGVALDSAGNLYIADYSNNRVREVNLASGLITTIAGNGLAGYGGDGGTATAAEIWNPSAIALDASGDLFIADYSNQRIRAVNLTTGVITTIAGGGVMDGQPATVAPLSNPQNVVVDSAGNLFIADANHNRVREVNCATGVITTVAGNGTAGYSGDGGPATAAELSGPSALVLDGSGDLFIVDGGNDRVREVKLGTDNITTVAGNGSWAFSGDGGAATSAGMSPAGVAVDSAGNLYLTDSNRVREVNHATGVITTVAGGGTSLGDGGPATAASLNGPVGIALDSAGNLYIADERNNRIREVNASTRIITTVAGGGTSLGDNGPATAATLWLPAGIAVDSAGDLFIADGGNSRVREVQVSSHVITTVAGNGNWVFSGDGGEATSAGFAPAGVTVDSVGNLFIADSANNRIREVTASTNLISTVAGNGSTNYGGDGGLASLAVISGPQSIAVDSLGNLYIGDTANNRVRKINLSSDLITTVAGNGSNGYSSDGAQATAAYMSQPDGVAVDSAGNLYIADYGNELIRMVNASTGILTTIAGNSTAGFGGDGGPAGAALLYGPCSIAIDSAGNLYIADSGNNRIREVAAGGVTLVVNPAIASSTTLTLGSPPTTTYGSTIMLSATLLCGGVAVSGQSISFSLNGSPVAVAITGANGVATLSTVSIADLVPGTYSGSLGASFSGSSLLGASAATANLTIIPEPLRVTANSVSKVYSTPDPAFSATYTGFVSGEGLANLGGTLVFATNEPSGGFAQPGSYTISLSGLTSSDYAITFAPGTLTVTPVTTSTTLGASTVSGVYPQSVTLTATVIATEPCAATPTGGTVTFMDGGKSLGTATLSGGTAVLTTAALAAGAHELFAIYSGDGADFFASGTGSLAGATITTVAGNGGMGYSGDGGQATAAEIWEPNAVAMDAKGDLFIADQGNNRVREVNSSGVITTVAGNGTSGYGGDGGQATAAELATPCDVFVDSAGNLYIADAGNNRIREVNLTTGVIVTIAGNGMAGYSGDNGQATAAELDSPRAVTEDQSGDLFIADCSNNRIREMNLSTGVITTVAGNGVSGYGGDGGQATAAELNSPNGVAMDASGHLFIADTHNSRIREVNLSAGVITTAAGGGTSLGDGGPATAASLDGPLGIALDAVGNLFIADEWNNRIREVDRFSNIITTVAGNGNAFYGGDGGPATAATIWLPCGVTVDASGRLFIADNFNDRVRMVTPLTPPLAFSVTPLPLTITVNNASKTYGGADPTFSVSYAGFAPGEGPANLGGSLVFSTTEPGSGYASAGTYQITASGLTSSNYSITFASGTLSVNAAPLTVTANDASKIYGGADPAFGVTYVGLAPGEGPANLGGSLAFATTEPGSGCASVGTYQITASGLISSNYSITFVPGTLTVSKAPLTVTADNKTVVVGGAVPTLTFSPGGTLYYGDSYSVISGVVLSTTTGAAAAVGTYPITASGGTAANYTIIDVAGSLTVTAMPTATTLSASASVLGFGQSLTLTATVTVTPPNTGTPTGGTVTFADRGATLGTAPLTAGVATLTTTSLALGSHMITACYSGDGVDYQGGVGIGAIGPNSIITTIAGNGNTTCPGDGFPATAAELSNPQAVAIDATGNIFIADTSGNRIREVVHATGVIITVAGNGTGGYAGDNGQASAAMLDQPTGIAVDGSGHLFIADLADNRVREVNLSSGVITTIAGRDIGGYSGDNGQATAAELHGPSGVAVDANGHLFIADSLNNRVREVTLSTGIVTTIAGNGSWNDVDTGDKGQATAALLSDPYAVAIDSTGHLLFIADLSSDGVRQVNLSTGIITTVAGLGNGVGGYNGDNGPATAAALNGPDGVAVDAASHLFIADSANNVIREVNLASGVITTIAGNGSGTFSGDSGRAIAAGLNSPDGIAVDTQGHLFIADAGDNHIRQVTLASGMITSVAGGGSPGDGSQATTAALYRPQGVAVDAAGDVFIADTNNNRIREVNHATGVITTVAGNGIQGYAGDNGPATAADLSNPDSVAVDAAGHLFIADAGNNRIRAVNLTTGVITTVAGNGIGSYGGDNGQATAAELSDPDGVAVDAAGHLFIADAYNSRVREVNLSTNIITTVAGNGTSGYRGDGGQGSAAELVVPTGVAVDTAGHLFIADSCNSVVREINLSTGVITTVAGVVGFGSYGGDNGQATAAAMNIPTAVAVDAAGNLFIADSWNHRVREVNLSTGVITTAVGNGTRGYAGDNGPGSGAELYDPQGIAVDAAGNIFITDSGNNRIREVAANSLLVTILPVTTMNVIASSSSLYGGTTSLTATLLSSGAGVPNETIAFSVHGSSVGTATTNANGVAILTGVCLAGLNSGTYSSYLAASFAGDASYEGSSTVANLAVTPTPLTVTANNATKTYGHADPTFSVSYVGFVPGENSGNLGGTLQFTTSEPISGNAAVGPYQITPFGLNSTNYAITFVSGTLSVNAAPLTITANNAGRTYGGADPVFSVSSYAGLVPGEGPANLGGTLAFTTTEPGGSHAPVGTYQITPSGLTSSNYAITFVPGTLAVSQAPLTITANNASKTYGQTVTFSGTEFRTSGLVSGDTLTGVTLTSAGAAATATVMGSPYAIVPSGAVGTGLSNYTVSYVNGNLTVNQAGTQAAVSSSRNPATFGQSVTITATVNGGAAGNPTGNVTFSVDGVAQTPVKLTAGDQATLSLSSLSAGTHTIAAAYGGDTDFSSSNSNNLTEIVVGPASLSQSTITVSASPITAGGTAAVTLVARDANGNQELSGGLKVAFGWGTGSASATFGTVTDNGNGTYTAAFTGTKAGSNTITATIAGQKVTSTLPTVTVVGPVSLSKSTITLSASQITSGNSATVTLVARDANGNQELGGGLVVAFRLGTGSASGTFGAVTDNGNGTYTATFTGSKAGSNTIIATIGGQKVTATPPTVKVIPGAVSLSQSTITVSASQVASGNAVTVTLVARDANGNQELGGGLAVNFGLGSGSAGGAFGTVNDHKNGTYTATFTGTTAGSNTITATIGGQGVTSAPPTLTVVPGAVSLSKSTLTVSASPVTSGGSVTMTLVARDASGNQEISGGLAVKCTLGSGTAGGTFSSVTDHKNGTYTATFTGTKAGSNTITATIGGHAVTSTPPTVTVIPGAFSLLKSTVTLSAAQVTSGNSATVTLLARDANGNQETGGGLMVAFGLGTGSASGTFSVIADNGNGTYTATITGTKAGSNTITATIGGQKVTSTPPTVTVVPGVVSLSLSTIAVSVSQVTSGGTATVTLVARDANGNQETSGGLKVALGLGTGSASGTFGTVTDHKNGTYTVTFTAAKAGNNTITATIGGQAIASMPPKVTVVPGAVSVSKSTITVSLSIITSASSTTVTFVALDANGNQELSGGLKVTFGLGTGSATGAFSAVTDNGNGTYTATFTANKTGSNTITATINGQKVTSTPPTVTVTSAVSRVAANDAALMAVLADGSTDVTGSKLAALR